MPIEIIDLTPQYILYRNGVETLAAYRNTHPAFFDHYFTYWGNTASFKPSLGEHDATFRRDALRKHITDAVHMLEREGLNLKNVSALLVVGQGLANGHALLHGSQSIAWYALETFNSEESMRVFAMHELVHAIHYAHDPDAYFHSTSDCKMVSRQLVTEGLASYCSMTLLSIGEEHSLWANTLAPVETHAWMHACRSARNDLYAFVRNHFDSSEAGSGLFHAANPRDIYYYRAGYYVGLKVIEELARTRGLSPLQLLRLPMKELVEGARVILGTAATAD